MTFLDNDLGTTLELLDFTNMGKISLCYGDMIWPNLSISSWVKQ